MSIDAGTLIRDDRAHGSIGPYRHSRLAAPRHAARQSARAHIPHGRRAPHVPAFDRTLHAALRRAGAGLLFDGQPRPLDRHAGARRGAWRNVSRGSRAVLRGIQPASRRQRPCLSGAILFLPAGRRTSLGGGSLRGAKPGASGICGPCRRLPVVERGGALHGSAQRPAGGRLPSARRGSGLARMAKCGKYATKRAPAASNSDGKTLRQCNFSSGAGSHDRAHSSTAHARSKAAFGGERSGRNVCVGLGGVCPRFFLLAKF